MSARDDRQNTVAQWCRNAFGEKEATSLPQRGMRLLEEALEAAQAAGVTVEEAGRVLQNVYARPVGALAQELGGVGVTLLAFAAAAKLSADEEETREVLRVLSKDLDHFRKRNAAKNAAGLIAGEVLGSGPERDPALSFDVADRDPVPLRSPTADGLHAFYERAEERTIAALDRDSIVAQHQVTPDMIAPPGNENRALFPERYPRETLTERAPLFRAELQGAFVDADGIEAHVEALWGWYYERTESFDVAVCGPGGMPRTDNQREQISRHAANVMREVAAYVSLYGISEERSRHLRERACDDSSRRRRSKRPSLDAEPAPVNVNDWEETT